MGQQTNHLEHFKKKKGTMEERMYVLKAGKETISDSE